MSVVINGCGSRLVRRDWERVVVHGLVVEKEGKEGCFVGSTGDLAGNHPGCRREREGGAPFLLFFQKELFCFFFCPVFFFLCSFFSSRDVLFFGLSLYVFPISLVFSLVS